MSALGFCEVCEHRDEKNDEISRERSAVPAPQREQAQGEIRPGPCRADAGWGPRVGVEAL